MTIATIQNILLILKAPLVNVFYLHQVDRTHSSSLFFIE